VDDLAREADDDVVAGVLLSLALGPEHLDSGVEEDQPEEVEGPRKGVDQRRPEEDEAGAGDEREDDAEEEDLLLVLPRHREAGHDDEEDEEVVHRERLLGDVPGEVLPAGARAAEGEYAQAEDHRDADIGGRPDRGLTKGGDVRLAHVEEEV